MKSLTYIRKELLWKKYFKIKLIHTKEDKICTSIVRYAPYWFTNIVLLHYYNPTPP